MMSTHDCCASRARFSPLCAIAPLSMALGVALLFGVSMLPSPARDAEAAETLFRQGETVLAPEARSRLMQGALDILAEALAAARDIGKGEPDPGFELQGDVVLVIGEDDWVRRRAWALSGIAEVQAKAGDREEAARSETEAFATARSIVDENQRDRALQGIAESETTNHNLRTTSVWTEEEFGEPVSAPGDIDAALANARNIENPGRRAWVLNGIAQSQARAGDLHGAAQSFTEAENAARGIRNAEDPVFERGAALSGIAHMRAKVAGDIEGAVVTARSIGHGTWRAATLRIISELRAKEGAFDDALTIVRSIGERSHRAAAISTLAQSQARAGDLHAAAELFTEALAVARSHTKPLDRALALRDIAWVQVEVANEL